jgi:hypothetical protein
MKKKTTTTKATAPTKAKTAPTKRKARIGQPDAKPAPLELIQIAQALPCGQWGKAWASQSYKERREALVRSLREARHVWQTAKEICEGEPETFYVSAAEQDAKFEKWNRANNDGSPKVIATNAAEFLGWTPRKFNAVWGRLVPYKFVANRLLSESFLKLLKAHEQRRERGNKSTVTRKRRARQGQNKKNL